MRLDRYLSKVSPLSRSQAQKAIRAGRVTVNGKALKQASMAVAPTAEVRFDGEPLVKPAHRYFMLCKPKGYVCSSSDRHNSTVLELLHEPVLAGLHFAGRLDVDATGLVLITDDGVWSHQITSPRRNCPKCYLVTLAEPLSAQSADKLRAGVQLRGEQRPTKPAELTCLSDTVVRLTITEGRYHQVKRMLAAVGNRVIGLHRESIANLDLDSDLEPGEYRPLSGSEIVSLNELASTEGENT